MSKIYSPHGGMVHLNGNLLCAVDVETTGVIPGYHEIFQVAIVPLNSDIKPLKTVHPFYLNITPQHLDRVDSRAMTVTKSTLADLILNSVDPWKAMDLLMEWFERLNLPLTAQSHKKLMPLWSNGDFDKSFLLAWLGIDHYNHIFHFHSRDTQAMALAINDRFYHHGEKIPFPKVGVGYLASCFDINQENAHNALDDCLTTAEIYRKMLVMYQPVMPGTRPVEGPEVYFGKGKPPEPEKPQETPVIESEPTANIEVAGDSSECQVSNNCSTEIVESPAS